MTTIDRMGVEFDGESHSYFIDGEKLLGVSTVAKIGDAESAWGIASAWGFRIGYEGAYEVYQDFIDGYYGSVPACASKDGLRATLKERNLTPWGQRDSAQERGNWVHDMLEALGQEGQVGAVLRSVAPEWKGHANAVLQWYLDYRPSFVALEVQVASREHRFAGRYDVRCLISGEHLIRNEVQTLGDRLVDPSGVYLCLVDLKTSKRIYPLTHYPQLAGYELASVEMGFPATDAQFVLNTNPDGNYDFKQSYSIGEDFVAYLGAMRAIRRLQAEDPEEKLKRAREDAILALLPSRSAQMKTDAGPLAGLDGKAIGILCSGMRKRGLVAQDKDKVWCIVGKEPVRM